ncbi:MAG TPA: hypothetical protein VJB59_11770, partial [Bdellovibrionota bacterium]|nr:hypothetical protein [Bdellovibrionota bacterium]
MNLNYEKIKTKVEQGGHQWTSYSDLFLVLSVTFLLLFVVANLRSGTTSIAASQALQVARAENDELKKQLKTYEVLKDDYLNKGASQDEVKLYQELMDKISLLETEAKQEHETLAKQANDARQKMQGLNRYQQLVKNIVNANLISSGKVQKRDQVIEEQTKELEVMDKEVWSKKEQIEQNNLQIAKIEQELQTKSSQLKYAYKSNAKRKAKYETELKELEEESTKRIAALRNKNHKYMQELDQTKTKLDEKNREAEQLISTLSEKEAQFKSSIEDLRQNHESTIEGQKRRFEDSLKNAQLSAAAKLEKEREYRAQLESQTREYQDQLGKLNSDLQGTQQKLHETALKYQGSIASLQKTNETLQRDLNASIRKLNQQRKLAEQIKKNFSKAGVNAQVDPKTGDVTIEFQPDYFDTDKASLKPSMRKTLEKTMPAYAKSLFSDPQVVKRLQSVEIVGFASPTFQGKVVDPA